MPKLSWLPDRRHRERRVVLFCNDLRERGGLANHASLLVEGFVDFDWDVWVVARSRGGFLPTVHTVGSARVFVVPGFGRRRIGALAYVIVGFVVGVVLALRSRCLYGLQLASPGLTAALVGRATGRPYYLLSTSSGPGGDIEYSIGTGSRLRRVLFARAAGLVAQTPGAATEFRQRVPEPAVHVVPTPVRDRGPEPLNGAPHVAFLGRLTAEKGLTNLLEAWVEVTRAVPEAKLLIIGSGRGEADSVEPELRRVTRQHPRLSSSVSFLGWRGDAIDLVARTDVFVLPSVREGLSNALLEACTLGRVVVASDIEPNLAVLGDDYPAAFPSGDAQAMAATLVAALTDDFVRHDARSRCLGAADHHRLSVVMRQHLDLIG